MIITLKEEISSTDSYVNITYNPIKEDTTNGNAILAQNFVSYAQSAVIMEPGFAITAYRDEVPEMEIKKETGTVTGKDEDVLPNGACVVFEYGTTVKSVPVKNGEAVNSDVANYEEDYNVYTGSISQKVTKK